MFEDFEDFEPLYFLDFARELIQYSNFEVNDNTLNRVTYGRIYYATFLYVREWLKNNWKYVSTKRDHTKMLNFIKKSGKFSRVMNHKIADDLYLLKSLRHQVDYYLTIPTEEELNQLKIEWYEESIETAFKLSEFIIQKFDEFDN